MVAPELYISGYPIDDLVLREDFLNLVEVEIKRLVESTKDGKLIRGTDKNLGGTMRLGSYEARLKKDSKISKI